MMQPGKDCFFIYTIKTKQKGQKQKRNINSKNERNKEVNSALHTLLAIIFRFDLIDSCMEDILPRCTSKKECYLTRSGTEIADAIYTEKMHIQHAVTSDADEHHAHVEHTKIIVA